MRPLHVASLLTAAVLLAAPSSADVVVRLENGQASVSATNATVREILAEWARVGQTRIVNVERVAGGPLTLELSNVPELQALDVILRTVSGYVAAPRAEAAPNAAQYDRIYLLATSTPAAAPPRPATPPPPAFQQPANAAPDDQAADDEVPRPNAPPRPAPPRPPFNTFPQPRPAPQQEQQPANPVTYTTPTAPFGVATPGMPVPVPQQPGQQPGQPGAQPR
jgi:hypothetical protein